MTISDIREFLKGKKTYLSAAIGLLTAVSAWAVGEIDGLALAAAIWIALQTSFIRAGIGKGTAAPILLAGILLMGGCSPSVEKWGQYSIQNLDELRQDIQKLEADGIRADELEGEGELDDHYSDFVGPDGQPVLLTLAQIQGKRAALSLLEKAHAERRKARAEQTAVLEAKLDRVALGVTRMRQVNAAWWRVLNDPQNQAILDKVLATVERLERKVGK